MTNAFLAFSKNLMESDFDKAMKLKQELLDLNENQVALDKIKINTCDIYKK